MKINNFMNQSQNPVCIGTGLVALDVIISSLSNTPTQFLAGGSCGNVLTILSYFGWSTFPIARLSNNVATELLLEDLEKWKVHNDFLKIDETGSTPVIIHRILKDPKGQPKHRFEFKNPENGKYLPSFKPCLAKSVPQIVEAGQRPNVYYFDRINRASIDLAKEYKNKGAIIFFEPSSIKDLKGFNECVMIADIVKFSDDRITSYEDHFPIAEAGLEIQTLGKNGLKFRKHLEKEWVFVEGYEIENVVDSAGAGDWCTAGLISKLFKKNVEIFDISHSEIISSLQFGQALSALNCTFEGARGLMYNMLSSELILYIEHILSLKSHHISSRKSTMEHQYKNPEMKISSLFTSV